MAFRPDQINGIHYLVSDNSGSYPNWGVYLSGSAGSGKLFSFYNISSTVSCSVSSSTTFVTGSNYFVDAVFSPLERRTYINIEGNYDAVSLLGNGTGSLSTTASLFLGNLAPSSSQTYSGSIFSTKVYSTITSGFTNFKSVAPRIAKPVPARASSALALVIGGGGGGGGIAGMNGGGGAGGFVLSNLTLTAGTYNVFVGAGGSNTNGQTSSIASIIAYGGGNGGSYVVSTQPGTTGSSGASGGGGGGGESAITASGGSAVYGTQGNRGGTAGTINYLGGGGGGAGESGQNGNTVFSTAGRGGAGLLSTISGVSSYYAGGGGGAGYGAVSAIPASGGLGGGGNGTTGVGQSGAPNTGGGGGGSNFNSSTFSSGGSGIVIIRYPGAQIATGGTVTTSQGDTIHTFTTTGSSTFTVF
jgi:hypothetical protein